MKFKGSQALKTLVILYAHVLWDGLGGQLVKLASHKGIAIINAEYIYIAFIPKGDCTFLPTQEVRCIPHSRPFLHLDPRLYE